MLIANILVLAVLIGFNRACRTSWPAALIFALFGTIIQFAVGNHILTVLIFGGIEFAFAFLYFWCLNRTESSSAYYLVLPAGIILYLAYRIIL